MYHFFGVIKSLIGIWDFIDNSIIMAAVRKKLGQMFIESGMIDNTKMEEALAYKKEHNVYFGKALISLKMVI